MDVLSESLAKFTVDLHKQLVKNNKKNILISPVSISSAFCMVLLGAKGNTASQIEKVFHFPAVEESTLSPKNKRNLPEEMGCEPVNTNVCQANVVLQAMKQLLQELNQQSNLYELSAANRMYVKQDFELKEQFKQCTEELLNAKAEAVDFQKDPEKARTKINAWVESQTKDKIKELFASGTISGDTVLVLVNAVYFKGKWMEQFDKKATKDEPFHLNKNENKTVKMMYKSAKFHLGSLPDLKCKILELVYEGNFSMHIVLPDEIDGLEQLENDMTHDKLISVLYSTNVEQKVEVKLPKFKIEETYDLKETLSAMGMTDVFNSNADFSNISSQRGLQVSKVVHKSYADVNEEGTEAAAATGIIIKHILKAVPILLIEFTADHPFLFFIAHKPTKTIMFYGRVTSP
ncbi:leukocyte elastase inhibitor [Bombina bombina]|uniref:leukocyte elastase inhibitor n=1 Tax=Bombina bombina TaxID=8345 RepID=UPI00235A8E90|nr:leukocyte elastase inhibitor [Bombina bombina]